MVKGISAVDSLYKNAKDVISNNKKVIVGTALGVTGIVAASTLLKQLARDEISIGHTRVEYMTGNDGLPLNGSLGYIPEPVHTDSPTLLEKVGFKLREKFGIDLNKVPDWADPTSKYLTDSEGKIMFSNVTHEPYINPWYDPEAVSEPISAVSSLSRPTMDEFIANATTSNTELATSAFAEVTDVFEKAGVKLEALPSDTDIDVDSVDDGIIDSLVDSVKHFFDIISDCV